MTKPSRRHGEHGSVDIQMRTTMSGGTDSSRSRGRNVEMGRLASIAKSCESSEVIIVDAEFKDIKTLTGQNSRKPNFPL